MKIKEKELEDIKISIRFFDLKKRDVLFKIAKDVPINYDIRHIAKQMRRVAKAFEPNPIGLAAPQIGIPLRIILVDTVGMPDVIVINPVITQRKLGVGNSREGCISFPGKIVKIKRAKMVYVEGYDENWKKVKFKLRGLESNVFQHEIDHLNGITIKNPRK